MGIFAHNKIHMVDTNVKIKIETFKGMAPKISPNLLPNNMSSYALNVDLSRGNIKPLKEDTPVMIAGASGGLRKILRYNYKSSATSSSWVWVGFTEILSFTRNTALGDTRNALFIQLPNRSLWRLSSADWGGGDYIVNPTSAHAKPNFATQNYKLADFEVEEMESSGGGTIPPSGGTVTGASLNDMVMPLADGEDPPVPEPEPEPEEPEDTRVPSSRIYMATNSITFSDGTQCFYGDTITSSGTVPDYVSPNYKVLDIKEGQRVKITNIPNGLLTQTDFPTLKTHIYRTVTTSEGHTIFREVTSYNSSNSGHITSYVDEKPDSELGSEPPCLDWVQHYEHSDGIAFPNGYTEIVGLSNGVVAKSRYNEIWFSPPFAPQTCLRDSAVSLDKDIVGLGAFGSTCVVLTKSFPVLIDAQNPYSPVVKAAQSNYPCTSKASIVNTPGGVVYMSNDGVVLVNSTTPTLLTKDIMRREDWIGLGINISTGAGIVHDNRYYYAAPSGKGFYINLLSPSDGLVLLDLNASYFHISEENNKLYYIYNGNVYCFNNSDKNRYCTWVSPHIVTPDGLSNISAGKLIFNDDDGPYSPEIGYSATVILSAHDNGPPYIDIKMGVSDKPFRFRAGYKNTCFRIDVSTEDEIRTIMVATSTGELT